MEEKEKAIKWFKEITRGAGLDRNNRSTLENFPRGTIAVTYWNDHKFALGMEYGVLWALWHMFDLSPDDLKGEDDDENNQFDYALI